MLDAYSIRKAIPRVLIAVIGINLSIYLCVAALDITTVVSKSMSDLLTAPFGSGISLSGAGTGNVTIEANAENNLVGGGILTALVGGLIAVVFNPLGVLGLLLPLIVTLTLIALAVLATLVIRQGLLMFLVVVSPVAIAAYILPGTEKYFQKWLDLFIKTLMVYPIIMIIFAISNTLGIILLRDASGQVGGSFYLNPGSLLSNPIVAQSDAAGTVKYILAIFVVYAPLALIPFAFKLAGGAMGAIMGAAQGGIRRANLGAKAGAGFNKSRQDPTSFLGKREMKARDRRLRYGVTPGQVTSGLGSAMKGRGYRAGAQGRTDLVRRMHAREAQSNPMIQQLAFDDNANAVMAGSGGTKAGAIAAAATLAANNGWTDEQRNRAIATASAVGFNSQNTMAAIDTLAQNKSRALNGALAGQGGMDFIRSSAMQVSGGNEQLADNVMGGFAYHSRNAGRFDLGGEGAGNTMRDGWQRAQVGQHMGSYGDSMQAYINEFQDDIQNGGTQEKRAAAVAFSEMYGAKQGATADNQVRINRSLEAMGIDHNLPISIEQQLANLANGYSVDTTPEQLAQMSANGVTHDVTAAEIHGAARKFGSEIPVQQQAAAAGGGAPPTPTPTPPAGGGGAGGAAP